MRDLLFSSLNVGAKFFHKFSVVPISAGEMVNDPVDQNLLSVDKTHRSMKVTWTMNKNNGTCM